MKKSIITILVIGLMLIGSLAYSQVAWDSGAGFSAVTTASLSMYFYGALYPEKTGTEYPAKSFDSFFYSSPYIVIYNDFLFTKDNAEVYLGINFYVDRTGFYPADSDFFVTIKDVVPSLLTLDFGYKWNGYFRTSTPYVGAFLANMVDVELCLYDFDGDPAVWTNNDYLLKVGFAMPMDALKFSADIYYLMPNFIRWRDIDNGYDMDGDDDIDADDKAIFAATPATDSAFNRLYTRQKLGSVHSLINVSYDMKDVVTVRFTNYFTMGLSLANFIEAAGFTADLKMVKDLSLRIFGSFWLIGAGAADNDGWKYAAINNKMSVPFGLNLSYKLDGGKMVAKFFAAFDLDKFISNNAKSVYEISAGIDLKMIPLVTIPIKIRLTNSSDVRYSSIDTPYYSFRSDYFIDPAGALYFGREKGGADMRIYLSLGISASF